MSLNDIEEHNNEDSGDLYLLHEFAHYDSALEHFDVSELESWTKKCFGRNTEHVRKNFRAHLSGHFVQNCTGPSAEHLFDNLKIASGDVLKKIDARYICDRCSKSRRYFCYTCFGLSPQLAPHAPRITLPVRIDILKHVKEVDGKSTCPHAAVLAPNQVRVFTYPNLPDDWSTDVGKMLLIFPRDGALTVTEYLKQHFSTNSDSSSIENTEESSNHNRTTSVLCLPERLFPFERVVFIDSTWRQTKRIINDPKIKSLPAVVIEAQETKFWRCDQRRPVTYLSTIEAIYYFCVEVHQFMNTLAVERADRKLSQMFPSYSGQYDNLLFFFKHTHETIRRRYKL